MKNFLKIYWICYNIAFVLSFEFFDPEACGILTPRPGIELAPSALEDEVLTTGAPGKSLDGSEGASSLYPDLWVSHSSWWVSILPPLLLQGQRWWLTVVRQRSGACLMRGRQVQLRRRVWPSSHLLRGRNVQVCSHSCLCEVREGERLVKTQPRGQSKQQSRRRTAKSAVQVFQMSQGPAAGFQQGWPGSVGCARVPGQHSDLPGLLRWLGELSQGPGEGPEGDPGTRAAVLLSSGDPLQEFSSPACQQWFHGRKQVPASVTNRNKLQSL